MKPERLVAQMRAFMLFQPRRGFENQVDRDEPTAPLPELQLRIHI